MSLLRLSKAALWTCCLGLGLSIAAAPALAAKVAMCHRPPGNPGKFRIISIAPAAVAAHLAHGDNLVEAEVCDGVDNDCDGVVDNNLTALGTCTVGTGVCERTAPLECIGGGQVCTAVEGPPAEPTEVSCNDGLDNDCDGLTDDEDPDCGCPCAGLSFGGITWGSAFRVDDCFNLGTSFYVAAESDPSSPLDEFHQLRIHSNGTMCDIRLSDFTDSDDIPLTPAQRDSCVASLMRLATEDGESCPASPY